MDLAESIGLQAFTERDAAGNPLLEQDEQLLSKFERMQLVLGADADQGEGTLFATPSRVIWLSASDPAKGFAVDFASISMHAVMSDPQSVERPCLYLQLDVGSDGEEGFGGGEEGGSEDEEGEEGAEEEAPAGLLPELRLVPALAMQLDEVFQAFCEGAARNPDPDAGSEGEGELFCDEDEVLAGAAAAGMHLNEVDEIAQGDLERFGDAEDGDEEDAAHS